MDRIRIASDARGSAPARGRAHFGRDLVGAAPADILHLDVFTTRAPIPLFFINVLALSVIMTWLYRQTRGDLLLTILVHLAANYCGWIGIPFNVEVSVEVVSAALIVICGGLRTPAGPRE
jgi:membrane protease YdiL (CAAX protease family)